MFATLPFLYVQFCGGPAPLDRADEATSPPDCRTLGAAAPFNVYTLGDFTAQHSNVGGRIAVGGDLDVDGYALGSTLPDRPEVSVWVGQRARIVNSRVHGGSVRVRGDCQTASVGHAASGRVACDDPSAPSPAAARAELLDLARTLAGRPPRDCSVTANAWGAVQITAHSAAAACPLDLDAVSATFGPSVYNGWINQITVSAPAGGTVVVNVRGNPEPWGRTGGFHLTGGIDAAGILWNFGDEARLSISGVGVTGSVLAPAAALRFDNGSIDGQVVVGSFVGTGQVRDTAFRGCL